MIAVWKPNMKKLSALGLVAIAALVAVLAMMGLSTPAQAYPELQIGVTASSTVLYGGQKFTATAKSNVDCSWNLEWNGVEREGVSSSGSDFQTRYTAPQVNRITKIPLHATCAYDASATSSARAAATASRTIMIT